MIQTGRVSELLDGSNLARIVLSDSESCESCTTRHVCVGLGSSGRKRRRETLVPNSLGAAVGDRVEVELRPAATMAIISVTFLLPLVGLIAGYLVGAPEGLAAAAIGCGVGLGIFVLVSILVNRALSRKPGFQLEMTRVLDRAGPAPAPGAEGKETGRGGDL